MLNRVILVGECNPYGCAEQMALYPLPEGAAGSRLRRILGLTTAHYVELGRKNLCRGRWSSMAANLYAASLMTQLRGCVFVCLGRTVARAFNGPDFFCSKDVDGNKLVSLPHPSGRCRLWNVDGNVERARAVLRAVAPDVPWGEVDS